MYVFAIAKPKSHMLNMLKGECLEISSPVSCKSLTEPV